MVEERDFLLTIKEHPLEMGPKLVFADWLEERGECERAKFLRESCQLAERPEFSPDQKLCLDRISAWFNNRQRAGQYLTLGGYAGTGKSTIIRHLAEIWPNAAVAALCGKAANVLRCKGVQRAQTIHSLIYEPIPDSRPVRFRRRVGLVMASGYICRQIIIDEASMVNEGMLADLLEFGVPIVFVGDHGQLEPVGRDSGIMREPGMKLEKIHRQAEGNPILRLAKAFREGRQVPYWVDKLGRLEICPKGQFWDKLRPDMTVICALNRTRHAINARVREMLGRKSKLPEPGDKLVCLQNHRGFQVFNGQIGIVQGVGPESGNQIEIDIRMDDDRLLRLPCRKAQFGKNKIEVHAVGMDTEALLFDWGNCLTAHKSQGSEFDSVIVYDQPSILWNMNRWRYTATTRAQNYLIYCM